MSRGYEARRKARRQQAQAAAQEPQPRKKPPTGSRHLTAIVPLIVIAAVLTAVALVGLGSSSGVSRKQVREEVAALLVDVPQHGTSLGSRQAPVIVQVFADLECPTVKVFAEAYLPQLIHTWVRDGILRLEYRSLETDTLDEHTFFRQEIAARAAGRQNKMWNFVLTFLHEQGQEFTGYATDEYLTEIAAQVPGLKWGRWRQDREDLTLFEQVALSVHSGRSRGLRGTPSFRIGLRDNSNGGGGLRYERSAAKEVERFLEKTMAALVAESSKDRPRLEPLESS
jgi:protein-disulfide isomerase